jgi:hypothetical protein
MFNNQHESGLPHSTLGRTRDPSLPSANRGVIAFAAWLNIGHAAVMSVMAVHLPNEREDLLIAAAVFGIIGAVLILLAPAKQLGEGAVRNP